MPPSSFLLLIIFLVIFISFSLSQSIKRLPLYIEIEKYLNFKVSLTFLRFWQFEKKKTLLCRSFDDFFSTADQILYYRKEFKSSFGTNRPRILTLMLILNSNPTLTLLLNVSTNLKLTLKSFYVKLGYNELGYSKLLLITNR